MKKILALILSITLLSSVVGCTKKDDKKDNSSSQSSSSQATSSNNQSSSSGSSSKNNQLSDNLLDFQVSINGTVISLPAEPKSLTDIGFKISKEDESKVVNADDSEAVYYQDDNENVIGVSAYNSGSEVKKASDCKISSISLDSEYLKNTKILLPKEITFGSTIEQVVAAYGEPLDIYEGNNGFKVYTYAKSERSINEISFTIVDNKVVEIEIDIYED